MREIRKKLKKWAKSEGIFIKNIHVSKTIETCFGDYETIIFQIVGTFTPSKMMKLEMMNLSIITMSARYTEEDGLHTEVYATTSLR